MNISNNWQVKMSEDGTIDEYSEFAIHLGHIYAHLNRSLNTRNQDDDISEEQWGEFSKFPIDIEPVR